MTEVKRNWPSQFLLFFLILCLNLMFFFCTVCTLFEFLHGISSRFYLPVSTCILQFPVERNWGRKWTVHQIWQVGFIYSFPIYSSAKLSFWCFQHNCSLFFSACKRNTCKGIEKYTSVGERICQFVSSYHAVPDPATYFSIFV